jgi:hypothetical protein
MKNARKRWSERTSWLFIGSLSLIAWAAIEHVVVLVVS